MILVDKIFLNFINAASLFRKQLTVCDESYNILYYSK